MTRKKTHTQHRESGLHFKEEGLKAPKHAAKKPAAPVKTFKSTGNSGRKKK